MSRRSTDLPMERVKVSGGFKTRGLIRCRQPFVAVKLSVTTCALHPRAVFRISRAHRAEVRNVFVRIEDEGVAGYGEASPNAFYDEAAEAVESAIAGAANWISSLRIRSITDVKAAWEEGWRLMHPSRAAQCAIDVALWDWLARKEGVSVTELIFGAPPREIASFCTIGLSEENELAGKVDELRNNPLIKIKSDEAASLDAVRFVQARCHAARIAIDANCAWSGIDIRALSRDLAALGVIFIEQPLPPSEDSRMREILAHSALPIFADESCVTLGDVERLAGKFSGFNIKLVKCGGITPALAMVKAGRAMGLQIMVGCMLESSALIAAGAVIAQQTDYADLDGAWLLRDDPFSGLNFSQGILSCSRSPGLGVEPAEIFPRQLGGERT